MTGNGKDTVTVTFLTNHEVDPEKYDLRYTKNRMDLIAQLRRAADPCGHVQHPAADSKEDLLETRERIKEVKQDA